MFITTCLLKLKPQYAAILAGLLVFVHINVSLWRKKELFYMENPIGIIFTCVRVKIKKTKNIKTMTLIKYNPNYRSTMPGAFSNMFDKFFYDTLEDSSVHRFLPNANVLESEKAYELQLAVPGFKKEDFNINFEEGRLTISGERNHKLDETITVHQHQIRNGSFERVFQLPDDADENKINASYKEGILYIEIQKNEKKIQKHKIAVK